MSETMDNLHIPPEVVEAADTAFWEDGGMEGIIRAALRAWVECGMAKDGVAWQAAIRDQHSWLADTGLGTPNGTFHVIILRTEAST